MRLNEEPPELSAGGIKTIFADLRRRCIGGVRGIRSSWGGLGPQAAFSEGGIVEMRMNSPPSAHMLLTCF